MWSYFLEFYFWISCKKFIYFYPLYEEYHFFCNASCYTSCISRRYIYTTVIEEVRDDMSRELYESFFVDIIHHVIDFFC